MSEYLDMALDAGYRDDEARQFAYAIEQREMHNFLSSRHEDDWEAFWLTWQAFAELFPAEVPS